VSLLFLQVAVNPELKDLNQVRTCTVPIEPCSPCEEGK